jgi:hypothetical protein
MWDIEAFALPPLLLGEPDAARALLRFRERGLAAAEANAALHGRGGVQFPWAANPLNGQESIRTDIPMVTVEEHVNMAVARAFSLYADVVGSNDFREQSAWPVLSGVARWVETRACRTERGLEIRDTLGFAEGRDSPVDNDAYVNMTAAVALRDAARLAALLDHSEDAARWNEAARALYLARDESGVILNHDRFSVQEDGPVGATPEALGGVFPFGYELPPDELRRTIGFYLDRVEPYLGSPMFSAPLGVFAAWTGDRARSAYLFEAGYADFANLPFWETDEVSRKRHPEAPVVGPFVANLGGFLTSLLYGLTRMRPDDGDPAAWFRGPAAMPELWDGIEVERLWVRGREVSLRARHGRPAELQPR